MGMTPLSENTTALDGRSENRTESRDLRGETCLGGYGDHVRDGIVYSGCGTDQIVMVVDGHRFTVDHPVDEIDVRLVNPAVVIGISIECLFGLACDYPLDVCHILLVQVIVIVGVPVYHEPTVLVRGAVALIVVAQQCECCHSDSSHHHDDYDYQRNVLRFHITHPESAENRHILSTKYDFLNTIGCIIQYLL